MAEQSPVEKAVINKRLPTKEECDSLIDATIDGDMEMLTKLIGDGVDMNAVIHEEYQRIALHTSSQCGHNTIVKKLLDCNVTIDCVDSQQWTPLHLAADGGHNEVVSTLLNAGADIEAREEEQITPLYAAAQNGHTNVIKILLDAKAEVDCICKEQFTPLSVAAENGHADVMDVLLQRNANVNHRNVDQETPLHYAAYYGHCDVVRILMEHNADMYCLNKFGKTPLDYAVGEGKSDVVKYFVEDAKMDTTKLRPETQQEITELLKKESSGASSQAVSHDTSDHKTSHDTADHPTSHDMQQNIPTSPTKFTTTVAVDGSPSQQATKSGHKQEVDQTPPQLQQTGVASKTTGYGPVAVMLDQDHPVNCKETLNHIRKQFKRFAHLKLNRDVLQDLYVEEVITHEEKIEIRKLDKKFRMEMLMDDVIIPSLQAQTGQKYICFINILQRSHDITLKSMASELTRHLLK